LGRKLFNTKKGNMKKEVVTRNGIKITISKDSEMQKLFEKALSREPKNDKEALIKEVFKEDK
jgi:hypothetical protein